MKNKQVKMYCIKLNQVRTKEEKRLGDLRYLINERRYKFRNGLSAYIKNKLNTKNWNEECSKLFNKIINDNKRYKQIEKELNIVKQKIHSLYIENKDIDRSIKSKNIKIKDVIAIGDNNLVRTLKLNLGDFTDKIITVKVGDMSKLVVEKIIKDGLTIDKDKKYKFFTAGAGQTRQKKFMMILDDENLTDIMLSLMCGLTIEDINDNGGMNINKFLAYLSLNNSGSTVWKDFDITKAIVVDDFETMVSAKVDYIDRQTNEETKEIKYTNKKGKEIKSKRTKYTAEWNIEKGVTMPVPIPHFDGLGIILDKNYKINMQVRLPWIKGLLTYFPVVDYCNCKENGYSLKVKDIYGKEWDIVEDKIKVIFTKSQFKLYKYYTSWEDYCNNFTKYNCTANICMQDSNKSTDYKDMNINYQMLQQLIHMTDEQIEILTADFKELIKKVHTDRKSQLEFLGATLNNRHRDYFQEALRIYPEMLNSSYVNKQISETITAEKKKACSGKIKIKDSKRVFILSDPTAFCDWLFGQIEKPEGYLQDGEVYANLYPDTEKLDILRSPSLSFEHVIRTNVRATKGEYSWYKTNALYTSTHDVISKILAFDVDGDEALIISTDWIIKLAEDMIKKYDINPIYFEMGKAPAKDINMDNIIKSLLFVYEKSNIGKVSNKLTNIWNGENPMEKYDIMQKLCAYNNDIIDSAKTLSIPKLPADIKGILKNDKYPYFFKYAKKKKEYKCKPISNSVMDRICKTIDGIENTNFDYKKGFGTFRIKTLMFNQNSIEINKDVISKYLALEKVTLDKIDDYTREHEKDDDEDMKKTNFKEDFYEEARKEFEDWGMKNNIELLDIIDNIIQYIYKKNDLKMAFLWNVFGQEIINNLNINIKKPLDGGYMMCEECGTRIKRVNNRQTRCKKCSSAEIKKKDRIRKQKNKIA